ncbi:hypothetical protein [Methanococcoides sp. AM1]|uniref:hypothetical protein n=1 Tax=Methanococcoides sp. AM1 TaxID=1201011 RepID=UPI0010840142|nr:hypothetical protein [Methanococcoides sp. AM1]
MNSRKIGLKLIVFLLILLFTYSIAATGQYCSFEGTTGNFELIAEEGVVELNASSFRLNVNQTVFRNINNIIVTERDGTTYNAKAAEIQVNYREKYSWSFPGTHLEATFNNITFEKPNEYNTIIIKGESDNIGYNTITSINENIIIPSHITSSVFFNGRKIYDFQTIELVVDDDSYVELHSAQIGLSAYQSSNYLIYSTSLKKATINSEGTLRLDDHKYFVETVDKIEISNSHASLFRVTDEEIRFNGEIESAFLNDEDIMVNFISYWFDQQTDKINAISSFIIAVATAVLVGVTWRQVKYSSKVTEQNDKNIKLISSSQQIALLQRKLELFYYPLFDFLKTYTTLTEEKEKNNKKIMMFHVNFHLDNSEKRELTSYNKIISHQYLAENKTKPLFEEFIRKLHATPSSTNTELIAIYKKLVDSLDRDIEEINNKLESLMDLE